MLGEALRLIRVFHDRKTGELAEGLGMSPSYVSEIESGKKTPSIEIIKKYADYFDTTPSAIMFFAEDLEVNKKKFNKAGMRAKLIKFLQIMENATESRES